MCMHVCARFRHNYLLCTHINTLYLWDKLCHNSDILLEVTEQHMKCVYMCEYMCVYYDNTEIINATNTTDGDPQRKIGV